MISSNDFVHITPVGTSRNLVGSYASLDMVIAIGFGIAVVQHDDRVIDAECPPRRLTKRTGGWLTLRTVEKMAKRHPRGRWEVCINGPLWSASWVRERPGKWVCYESGDGFA